MKELWRKYGRWGGMVLATVLLLTAVGGMVFMGRSAPQMDRVSLPVVKEQENSLSALESFRQRREEGRKADRLSLEKILARTDLDVDSLSDAAAALERLVTWNEEELALEGALMKSRISPCVVVRSEGMVTIVTDKAELSQGESALLMTLCQSHTGVPPQGVKVLCAEENLNP